MTLAVLESSDFGQSILTFLGLASTVGLVKVSIHVHYMPNGRKRGLVFRLKLLSCALCNFTIEGQQSSQPIVYKPLTSARNIFTSWNWAFVCFVC